MLHAVYVWKNHKYKELLKSMDYKSVTFINVSMGSLGIIGKDSINSHKLLKATNMDKNSIAYCIKKLSACCMRCTYYLFQFGTQVKFRWSRDRNDRTAENAFSAPWFFSEIELEPAAG